jgi:hypothetical protein
MWASSRANGLDPIKFEQTTQQYSSIGDSGQFLPKHTYCQHQQIQALQIL